MFRFHLARSGAIALVTALLAAGCSAADDSGSTKEASTDDVAAAAAGQLKEYRDRPTAINVTEPLAGKPPAGKTVYWIQCGAPACATLGDFAEEAGDALDWKVVRVNAGLSPETIKNAWGEAARAVPAPDGVIFSGFPREIYEDEIQTLAGKDVPIVTISVDEEAGNGVTAVLGAAQERNVKTGHIQALYSLAQEGADANAVFFQVPAFPTHLIQAAAFEETFGELCGDCALDVVDLPAESMGTDMPQRIVAYLQAHPDVNSVTLALADMAIGLPAAIRDAGLQDRITIVTDTPDTTVATYLAEGDVVVASTTYPGKEMIWQAFDIFIRQMLGEDFAESAGAPTLAWLVTKDNIPDPAKPFPLVEDYREQFLELWNLG